MYYSIYSLNTRTWHLDPRLTVTSEYRIIINLYSMAVTDPCRPPVKPFFTQLFQLIFIYWHSICTINLFYVFYNLKFTIVYFKSTLKKKKNDAKHVVIKFKIRIQHE